MLRMTLEFEYECFQPFEIFLRIHTDTLEQFIKNKLKKKKQTKF